MKVLIAGDYCPWERVAKDFAHGNYNGIATLQPIFAQSDYSIVNLECPIVRGWESRINKNGPHLHADTRALEALKSIGTKCVTLANNHFRDFGEEGVQNTLSEVSVCGIDYVGGGENASDAATILYKKIGDETLAIINCCESEFSIATAEYGGANPINLVQQYYSILEAKKRADYVLVIVHGGVEHYQLPTPRMQETYRFFIDVGADVVINHHQHCYSGYEMYKNKPIFYGLGNFCFDNLYKRNGIWNKGYMVEILFSKTNIEYHLIPYTQCDAEPEVVLCNETEKMAFAKNIEALNAIISESNELQRHYKRLLNDTRMRYRSHMEPYYTRIARFLFRKHLLPSFMRRKYLIISNLIHCESHRERLLDAISVTNK